MISFTFTPPSVHAGAVVHAAAESVVGEAAHLVLDESQRLVPVDTGALKNSGRVSQEGLEAAISYGAEDGAGRNGQDTAKYAVPVHERLDAHHPVGSAKFLEIPLHSEAPRIGGILASGIRKALET